MDINSEEIKKIVRAAKIAKGKSDEELIKDIAQMIKSGQGGIDSSKARNLIKMVAPMLESQQRDKLEKLLNELKD
jgi:predicted nucleotidyltransferase